MNEEDRKIQKQLVDEMMKVSKTNPDVMIYMQALMENYEKIEKKLDQYKNNWEELKKWLEQEWLEWKDCEDARTKNFATEDKNILDKMKELEEGK